jgi:hypothetical protein
MPTLPGHLSANSPAECIRGVAAGEPARFDVPRRGRADALPARWEDREARARGHDVCAAPDARA